MLTQHGIVGMGIQPSLGLVWWGVGFLKTGAILDNFKMLSGSCPEPRVGQSHGIVWSFFSQKGKEMK